MAHLKGILFLDGMDGCRQLPELVERDGAIWGGAAMARTRGVLGGEVDKAQDGRPRRSWHGGGTGIGIGIGIGKGVMRGCHVARTT